MEHIGYAATNAQKAGATRSRRAKAGMYPTKAHKAAFTKLVQPYGAKSLTREDMLTLSTHPWLTCSQREQWLARAQAAE
jgi:hypothetical protein